jgi:hypothetical protein
VGSILWCVGSVGKGRGELCGRGARGVEEEEGGLASGS